MSDLPGPRRAGQPPPCPECRSDHVRTSRSSYPHDKEKTAGRTGSFWRCGNCGARFLGPLALERTRESHHRAGGRNSKDGLRQDISFARTVKRWLFPLLAIMCTIIAVLLVLYQRNSPSTPPSRSRSVP